MKNTWNALDEKNLIKELNTFFIEVSERTARKIFNKRKKEVFAIYCDGSDHLIETTADFDGVEMFAVEK